MFGCYTELILQVLYSLNFCRAKQRPALLLKWGTTGDKNFPLF